MIFNISTYYFSFSHWKRTNVLSKMYDILGFLNFLLLLPLIQKINFKCSIFIKLNTEDFFPLFFLEYIYERNFELLEILFLYFVRLEKIN